LHRRYLRALRTLLERTAAAAAGARRAARVAGVWLRLAAKFRQTLDGYINVPLS